MIRNGLAALILTAVAACGALAVGSAGASASAVVPPTGHFGNARPVLGPGNVGLDATIIEVSCPPSGGCVEGGTMGAADGSVHAFAAFEQHDRTWGPATPVLLPDPAFTSSALHEVSCGAPGNCVVAGDFDANSFNGGNFGFYAVEKNGQWIQSASVSGKGVGSEALTVSCPTAGDCAVGGKVSGQPFTVEEKGGTWGLPQPVPGLAGLNEVSGFIREISCVSPGNCAAVGTYHDSTAPDRVFVVDENGGTWGLAHQIDTSMIKDSGADPSTISCASPGDCAIGGTYLDAQNNLQDFVADEAGGQWKSAQRVTGVPNTGQFPGLFQLSCPAAGECVAVGRFETTDTRAFVAQERDGKWQRATTPGGLGSEAISVYCPSARNCVVTGTAVFGQAAHPVAFTRYEVNGTWGKLNPLPGVAALNAGGFSEGDQVTCGSAGNCALGGEYAIQGGSAPFAAISSPATSTSLKLSAGQVRFGQEQKEKISVKAVPRTGGTPGGNVTVRAGNRTLCVIKLVKGQGSGRLGARALKPGHYQLTAAYGGSQTYRGSKSGGKTLTVNK